MQPEDGTNGKDANGGNGETWRRKREALLETLEAEFAQTASWTGVKSLSPEVRDAILKVPRHRFVPPEYRAMAYQNRPLPIGAGQTISQPYIVALMTELANLRPEKRVLEIGTGCGYQAAVLAEIASGVFTVETVESLAETARARLEDLGYTNMRVRHGDGSKGWPEEAPFDAILVTAAAPRGVEERLCGQLAPGGRLVIPVESQRSFLGRDFGASQELKLLEKTAEGHISERGVLPVAFVPLVGGA